MVYTIRVWYGWLYHTRMVYTIRVRYKIRIRYRTAAPTISSINMQTQTELEQLRRQEVAELKVMVQALQVSSKPPRRRSRSPAPHRQAQDVCWYHAKYGEAAHKCTPPCSKSG